MNTAAPRWCVRPAPGQNELLSSWLHRLALANAIADHTLCRHMFGRLAIWNRDVDRCFPEEAFPILSQWTGVAESQLAAMKLTHWAGRLSESVNRYGNNVWILPLGVFHRIRRRCGLQFCAACLREGPIDAVWKWRMAWATCCRRHQLVLLEDCPGCGSPYVPHRMAPSLFGRACCPRCGTDVSRATQRAAEHGEIEMQQRLETALLEGHTQIDNHGYFALPLFEGLRRLVRVVLSAKWSDLALKVRGIQLTPVRFANGTAAFEFQHIATRREVLSVVWVLLKNWPNRFLAKMREASIPRHAFDQEGQPVPFWLQQGLDHVPGTQPRVLEEEEVLGMCRWLAHQGERVTWTSVLEAFGIEHCSFKQPCITPALVRFAQESSHRR